MSRRASPCRMPSSKVSTAGCAMKLLNETRFTSRAQAHVALGCWRADYNEARPHSQPGWKTPSEFAFTGHLRRELALRRELRASSRRCHSPTGQSNSLDVWTNSGLDKTWGQGQFQSTGNSGMRNSTVFPLSSSTEIASVPSPLNVMLRVTDPGPHCMQGPIFASSRCPDPSKHPS